jgi:hypothetical protein
MSTNHLSAETVKRYYRVDRREIAFLRFIFEAYDGLAVIETLDPEAGVIVFHISPGSEHDVEMILLDLNKHIMMKAIEFKRDELLTRQGSI